VLAVIQKNRFNTLALNYSILYFLQGNWDDGGGGGMTAGDLGGWGAPLPATRSQPNLAAASGSRQNCLDTSWLAQERWESACRPPQPRGLLTRCAVSYQNIGPAGEIFGDAAPPGRGSFISGSSSDSSSGSFSTPPTSTPEGSLGARSGAVTTNVAWLVGAKKAAGKENPPPSAMIKTMTPSGQHHIDIREDGVLMAPNHLAVAPLDGELRVSPAEGQSQAGGGYMLARSHTIGNLPLWAQDLQGEESLPRPQPPSAVVLQLDEGTAAGEPPMAATLSTRGSLRSKIGEEQGESDLIFSLHFFSSYDRRLRKENDLNIRSCIIAKYYCLRGMISI